MESVKGKHILVVGATGSIGKHTARLLVGSGAQVYITGRQPQKLQAAAAELGIDASRSFVVDVTNEADVAALSQGLAAAAPALDILVIASGIGIIKTMETLTVAEFQQTLQTNLVGPFLLLKYLLPPMKEQKKGLIINIPGVLGKVPMAGAAAYSASKYGLTGMMQSIREELKRTEIRITNLFMGGVDSAFWDTIDLRVQRDKMIVSEEAAKAIWFLCQQPRSGVVSEMVLQPFNHQAI
ncbi:MAG: SDR family oxidoreductase [Bacteroidetes bacterium]|nr:MAG: SDR family oxidoreductase [Bacteroidota bacterium]